jgi:hypothetical protein
MRKIRFYYDVVCPYSYMETPRSTLPLAACLWAGD